MPRPAPAVSTATLQHQLRAVQRHRRLRQGHLFHPASRRVPAGRELHPGLRGQRRREPVPGQQRRGRERPRRRRQLGGCARRARPHALGGRDLGGLRIQLRGGGRPGDGVPGRAEIMGGRRPARLRRLHLGAGYNYQDDFAPGTHGNDIINVGLKYGFGAANVSVGWTFNKSRRGPRRQPTCSWRPATSASCRASR